MAMDSGASRLSLDPQEESSQRQQLLEKDDVFVRPFRPQRWRRGLGHWLLPLLTHLLLISLYTLAFLFFETKYGSESRLKDILPFSPANEAVEWRTELIESTVYKKSPYSGNPSHEIDQAWNQLTNGFNLRVSEKTLQKMNRTSIPLSDGSGYIAGLDTTHHLHCLISIRHALAPEYYAGEIAGMYKPEGEVYPTHIAHCLEILRMMILCKSDGSLFTYAWSMEQKAPLTNFAVEHTCTNWDRLTDWARENSFNIHDDLLVHPKFGKWPDHDPV